MIENNFKTARSQIYLKINFIQHDNGGKFIEKLSGTHYGWTIYIYM